jgi:hypothetical protein
MYSVLFGLREDTLQVQLDPSQVELQSVSNGSCLLTCLYSAHVEQAYDNPACEKYVKTEEDVNELRLDCWHASAPAPVGSKPHAGEGVEPDWQTQAEQN